MHTAGALPSPAVQCTYTRPPLPRERSMASATSLTALGSEWRSDSAEKSMMEGRRMSTPSCAARDALALKSTLVWGGVGWGGVKGED